MSREILTSGLPKAAPAEHYREGEEEHPRMGAASTAETSAVCSARLWALRRCALGILPRRPFRRAF